jgi:hypothetical protein
MPKLKISTAYKWVWSTSFPQAAARAVSTLCELWCATFSGRRSLVHVLQLVLARLDQACCWFIVIEHCWRRQGPRRAIPVATHLCDRQSSS